MHQATAAGIAFLEVPVTLPRDSTVDRKYSPLVILQYSGLGTQVYTVRVHLLETQTGAFNCGCAALTTMWCNATFSIDNTSGNNASGIIVDARLTDVGNYNGFLWDADLLDQSGTQVATAQPAATSTTNRSPVLAAIGNKSGTPGQAIDFTVTAGDFEGDGVTISAQSLPAGATFDGANFHWVPSTPGTYSGIRFIATQSAPALGDAELIDIVVGEAGPPGELAFTVSVHTVGESGPSVLTVTRSNGSDGSVSVAYATVNDTAMAGSDYTATSGTLTFADGEVSRTIRVPGVNDPDVESNETFQLQLSAPTGGATLGTPSTVTVTIVDDDDPQLAGSWGPVIDWPVVPIHMHLVPPGKVMFWDRNGDVNPASDATPRLWDPAVPAVVTTLAAPAWDIFCSGHTWTADGRLLVTGGHIHNFVGVAHASIYDPVADSWTALPDMNEGRWYPTNTTLPNGDVLVLAGTRNNYNDINPLPQVWQSATNTWRNLTTAMFTGNLPGWPDFYPYAYVAPNGKVFMAGPQQTARYLDTSGTGSWSDVAGSGLLYRDYGSSVMYGQGKVLIVGGNPRDVNELVPINLPSATAEVIDLGDATPAWRSVAPMSIGRRHHNTTLLPDSTVLVTGGSSTAGHDDSGGKVLYAELWNPVSETWTPMAAHSRYRGYHSNALLLPDGRVLIAGGGHPNPADGSQPNAEIYSPPYLFQGARPTITSAPATVTYGQAFAVGTPDAATIGAVRWIRVASVTHAFNESQRINTLTFTPSGNTLNVTAPATANLCPPGDYMLFIVKANGVPSVAHFVRVAPVALQIATVTPSAGRTSGGQQITLTGTFAGLTSVTVGGVTATWAFSNGTSEIIVTTPAHAAGAVSIELTPSWGPAHTKPNAFGYLRTTFTDDTIVVQSTPVKAQHVLELREAAETLRLVAGLSAPAWTDPALTVIRAVHITQLRMHLEGPAYTDTPLDAGTNIKRLHIEELRERIRAIATF